MLINENISTLTPSVLGEKEIQEATASEPLTLDEEYGMQQSWRQDADKLTFITCQPIRSRVTEPSCNQATSDSAPDSTCYQVRQNDDDAPDRMIGDVNLFLKLEEKDDNEETSNHEPEEVIVGEVELMIAEKHLQRKGLGRASLICFLKYIVDHTEEILAEFLAKVDASATQEGQTATTVGSKKKQFEYLVVRIAASNGRSIALFQSLDFAAVSDEPNVFGELELRKYGLSSSGELQTWLQHYDIEGYRELAFN
ncbi:hypothetical protein FQN49_000658 [Arthroderma sp. PD_2]|nr:hypothetical protein FQN49_000658 [Arthroderma sp. PD_2]